MSNQVPAISRKNDAIHTAMCAHGWPAGRPLDGANNAAKIFQLKQGTPAEKREPRT